MSMENIENIFWFIGGIGFFLYGMNLMASGIQKAAGNKLKNVLKVLTRNRFMAIIMGAVITAIIQSSSATTVMVVGFVNAGLMNLAQAVGIIMGANVGTTATSWIISAGEWMKFLKPEFLAPLLVGIGAFVMLFSKREKVKNIAVILIGFGALFTGLKFMSDSVKVYKDAPVFVEAFQYFGANPVLGVITGTIITALLQSSSASIGILQTLAVNGMVSWNAAVYIMLGQNVGTCITAMMSSIGAGRMAKRAAAMHLLFNVAGVLVFGFAMFIVFRINNAFADQIISSTQISIFHTLFNVGNVIILLPFANLFIKISGYIFKEKPEDNETVGLHLDDRLLETPAVAIESTKGEICRLGDAVIKNVTNGFASIMKYDKDKVRKVFDLEKKVDEVSQDLNDFLVKINRLVLTNEQEGYVTVMFNTVSDLERISDHAENLAEIADIVKENKITFSEDEVKELSDYMDIVTGSVTNAVEAYKSGKSEYAFKTKEYEKQADSRDSFYRKKHMARLGEGNVSGQEGAVYFDILTNLERISDHSENIAERFC